MDFKYFTGEETEDFTFYRIPKILFSDNRFKKLSLYAKVLYSVLLDRMSLSVRNGWVDKDNHVFIYYTIESASEFLGVGRDKTMRLFSELDDRKGCGLIRKKIQGLGKPARIYVMNFNIDDGVENSSESVEISPSKSVENSSSKNRPTSVYTKPQTSVSRNRILQDVVNFDSNNKDNNKNNIVIHKDRDIDYYNRLNLCRQLTRDIINGTYEQNKDRYIELKS